MFFPIQSSISFSKKAGKTIQETNLINWIYFFRTGKGERYALTLNLLIYSLDLGNNFMILLNVEITMNRNRGENQLRNPPSRITGSGLNIIKKSILFSNYSKKISKEMFALQIDFKSDRIQIQPLSKYGSGSDINTKIRNLVNFFNLFIIYIIDRSGKHASVDVVI